MAWGLQGAKRKGAMLQGDRDAGPVCFKKVKEKKKGKKKGTAILPQSMHVIKQIIPTPYPTTFHFSKLGGKPTVPVLTPDPCR